MISAADLSKLEQVAQRLDPRAKLLAAWTLKGGISAQMDALEVALGEVTGGDGQTRKLIVRRPGAWAMQHNPNAAADEFRILQLVQQIGVKTPTPYLLDTSGEIFPAPYLVIEYIEGAPDYAPADVTRCVTQMATQLATLHHITGHHITGTQLDLTFLPRQAERLAAKVQARPATLSDSFDESLDESLDEGRIRDALQRAWPLPQPAQPALLHGDFWPGNLLWRDGELVAVIDWEDAEVGNPLADLATTRLDVLWIFGRAALETFTARYCDLMAYDLTACDLDQLPAWDLVAALRPMGRLAVWAADWAELGRTDITEATMAAGHRWFVQQALAQLAAR